MPWGIPAPEDIPNTKTKLLLQFGGKINIRKWNLNQEPVNSEGFGLGFNHLSFKFGVNQEGAELVLLNQHCLGLKSIGIPAV